MTKKTRLIILIVFAALFLTITPYSLLYSLGYRVDFENKKIVATGGIYVRVFPDQSNVTIDNKISNKTGLFSNSVFVENLLPKQHIVTITKDGYYDYQKNLPVLENQVTKLENVVLFKKDIQFYILQNKNQFFQLKQLPAEKFIIKNKNLYYVLGSSDLNQSPAAQQIPVIKNIIAYQSLVNGIIWLGSDGFLKSSDTDGSNTQIMSLVPLKINPKESYQIKVFNQNIFLKQGNDLLLFDQEKKSFENFYSPISDFKISPDGRKIVYFNSSEIFIYYFDQAEQNNVPLLKSNEKISDCYWLNSDYIIFSSGNSITISEIDARGNVNKIVLPQKAVISGGGSIDIKKPQIFFNRQDKKLYVLTGDNLIVSEALIP